MEEKKKSINKLRFSICFLDVFFRSNLIQINEVGAHNVFLKNNVSFQMKQNKYINYETCVFDKVTIDTFFTMYLF